MGGTQGTGYQDQIVATGGTGPYTFTIPPTSNPLPPGLILDSNTGVISGTLALPGTYTFTVQVQDSTGATVTQSYTIVVGASGSALQFDTTSLGNGTVGSIYNDQLAVSGGTGPYTFSITSGPLPAGLTLNSDSGQISGIAAAAGNYPLTIQVQDSTGATQTTNLAITINPAIPYMISGKVYNSVSGALMSGVLVSLSGDATASVTTLADGAYKFENLDSGKHYTVTATKTGNTFAPDNYDYPALDGDKANEDFAGTAAGTYVIMGRVTKADGKSG
ncbi:MAG: putative Ig domain-containing protein, partial [Candidatus Margulisiibacteriota bacterium]